MSPVWVRLSRWESRQAEVGDPERAVGIDQEVGRLDVAMDDSQAMGVVKRVGGLGAQPGDIAAKGPIPVRRSDRGRCQGVVTGPRAGARSQDRVGASDLVASAAARHAHGSATSRRTGAGIVRFGRMQWTFFGSFHHDGGWHSAFPA